MRVVHEFVREEMRVSVFSWNNKYILKFELGPLEQTFKISETDVMEESDLNGFFEGQFLEKVKNRFAEMGSSMLEQLNA